MNILISNKIRIDDPTPGLKHWVQREYTIDNPEYITRVRLNKWLGGTPKKLKLYEEYDNTILLPYGCLQALYIYLIHAEDLTKVTTSSKLNVHATADWEGNTIIPRDYQEIAVNAMVFHKFGILKAPCSSGKTIMGHLIAQKTGMRTLWLTHTTALLKQSKAVGEIILGKSDRVGTITDGNVNPGRTITYATVQTMAMLDPKTYKDQYNCVICDECFPGNTKIATPTGFKELKSLCIGDIITSYNTKTKKLENKTVNYVFKLKAHDVVIVTLSNGKQMVCTSNHPFYTQSGEWKRADELGENDYVMQLLWEGDRRNRYLKIKQNKIQKTGVRLLQFDLRKTCSCKKGLDGRTKAEKCRGHAKIKQRIPRSDCGTHEEQQPYERSCDKRTRFKAVKRDRASSKNKMRKWLRSYCSTAKFNACFSGNVGSICGISCSYTDGKRFGLSDLLQSRYSRSVRNDRNRSRWKHTRCVGPSSARQKENRVFEWLGVESITVQKQTSDGTFAGLCEDGYVYNIEVADNNNYFAEGVLVHNCHRVAKTAEAYTQFSYVLNNVAAEYKYGLSATPETHNGYGKSIMCNIGDIKHEIPQDVLEENGTIMQVDIHPIETGWSYPREAFKADGVLNFEKAVTYLRSDPERNELIADLIGDRPTLILSNNIDHLCYIANKLSAEQQATACLVSTKHDEDVLTADILCKHGSKANAEYIDKMRSGELNIMFATYQLAKEGLNIPRLEQVILAFPAVDANIITQSVGRVARCCDGKESAVCYDLVDTPTWFQKHFRERKKLYNKNGNKIVN